MLAAGVSAASCGYALAGRGSFLPDYIKTLGIPMFGNATPYQSVEQVFTQKVRLEFQSSRRYTVVPSDEGVDGVVRGEISSISLAPVSLNDAQLATRYRVTVIVKIKFEDVKAQQDVVGERGAVVLRRIRARQAAPTAPTWRRSSATSASRWIACRRTSRARWSARFSRRFDRSTQAVGRQVVIMSTVADIRKQIKAGKTAPLYLLEGDDLQSRHDLAIEFANVVDEGLQAFNVQSFYANEATNAGGSDQLIGTLLSTARTLPMMSPRRVIIVHEADRLLAPKRAKDEDSCAEPSRPRRASAAITPAEELEAYIEHPSR